MKREPKRTIHLPRIYEHFKGEKYITLLIATHITREEYNEQLFENNLEAFHTEKNYHIQVVEKNGVYRYIGFQNEGELIIYMCVSGKNFGNVYARPVNMFAERLDTKKYPDAKQIYRFEKKMNKLKEVEI